MITIDFETRSACDLRACGASVYARHPSTSILCLAWKIDEGPVCLWRPEEYHLPDFPSSYADLEPLFHAIAQGREIEAHNVFFERSIWSAVAVTHLGWPEVPTNQWRCSAAACARQALPRSLAGAGEAVGLESPKDKQGHQVMLRLCKPKAKAARGGSVYDDDPAKFRILYEYCKQDVRAESELSQTIEPLTQRELRIWQLDQEINLRGIPVDVDAVKAALAIAEETKARGGERIRELTGGEVQAPSEVAKILKWLGSRGVELAGLTKADVAEALGWDLPPDAREVLELRQRLGKSSVAKLEAMLNRVDDDGRARGNLTYHGASTGRWSGAGIQPQNYPRGSLSPAEIELAHSLLESRDSQGLELIFGDVMGCLSSCLRSMIRAEHGHELLVCDFAAIEARVLAWVAGQSELVQAFDSGVDVYVEMAAQIYEVAPEGVTKEQRHVGKTAVLGCGYGMGARAFVATCSAMTGLRISRRFSRRVVQVYRETNAQIVNLWRSLNSAAIQAIETGDPVPVGLLELWVEDDCLKVRLPSGRALHYHAPEVVQVRAPWSYGYTAALMVPPELEGQLEELDVELGGRVSRQGRPWFDRCSIPEPSLPAVRELTTVADLSPKAEALIDQVQFEGVIRPQGKWGKKRTYGGMLAENIVQAVSRDLLAEAMLRLAGAGYSICATVHDEVICEEPEGADLAEFEALMVEVPAWASGCPVAVESYRARRYKK